MHLWCLIRSRIVFVSVWHCEQRPPNVVSAHDCFEPGNLYWETTGCVHKPNGMPYRWEFIHIVCIFCRVVGQFMLCHSWRLAHQEPVHDQRFVLLPNQYSPQFQAFFLAPPSFDRWFVLRDADVLSLVDCDSFKLRMVDNVAFFVTILCHALQWSCQTWDNDGTLDTG